MLPIPVTPRRPAQARTYHLLSTPRGVAALRLRFQPAQLPAQPSIALRYPLSLVLLLALLAPAAATAAAPGAASTVPQGLALPPYASQLRQDCNSGRPHVEIRDCMLARSKASTQEVETAEDAVRDALNTRAETLPHLKRSTAQFDAAAKAHARYRLQQCEFAAGLAVGQRLQREQRLGCLHDVNLKRLQQLEQIRQTLP